MSTGPNERGRAETEGAPSDPYFRFHLFGPFAVSRDGNAMPDREIGSRKGRTLLKMLLLERGRVVPADRIAEVLWGDTPPPKWDRDVATLVSRLRGVFGSDSIRGSRDGYRFAPSARFEADVYRSAATPAHSSSSTTEEASAKRSGWGGGTARSAWAVAGR